MKSGRPTIKEIAARTGVSIGTVHRAIYGKEGVGEETRKRILEEVERMNYHVDEAASSLKRKVLTIAVALPRNHGEERFYFRGIWEGIRQAAANLGKYKVEFRYFESEYSLDKMAMELQRIYDTILDDIDGLITISDSEGSNEWIARFYKQGVTVVLVSSYGRVENCFCSIKVEHEKAGRLAAEYMRDICAAREGRLLVLTGNRDIFSNRRYADAFLAQMKEYDASRGIICVDGFGYDEINERCREILSQEHIAGIFVCNARNTYTVCGILQDMGLEKVFFIGTDVFHELKPYFDSGVINASIYQYNREQGSRAVEILYQYLISGSRERGQEYLPIGLVLGSNSEYFMN